MKNKLLRTLTVVLLLFLSATNFAQAPPLGTAADFVLFSTVGAVGNTGISQVTGNVGTNSGAITGFGNVNGVMNTSNGATAQCAADLLIAYNQLNSTIPGFFPAPLLGNGQILNAGVYSISGAATLNLELTLDGQNNPDAVFIFQIQGPFSTGADSKVKLINGALACNVFWKIEGLVDMASGTTMRGTIIANNAAINMNVGDTLEGRALSTTGAVNVSGVLAYTPIGCGSPVLMGPAAPDLVSAACYAVFSGDGPVSNAGITYVTGDVGTNVGLTTGFNPLFVTGMIHPIPDGSTAAAATDLQNAYIYLNTLPFDIQLLYPAQFGHNLVLTPHTYLLNAATSFTDTLYLNAGGQADAVFVIQINGALSTSTYAKVILINGALAENVYWKVDGAVSINDYSVFKGTVVANNGAVLLATGVNLEGRAFTTTGALGTTAVTVTMPPGCGTVSSPEITTEPTDQTACENGMVSFSVSATGTGLTYQWRRGTEDLVDGLSIFGATTNELTLNPVLPGDAASDYNVVVAGMYPPAVTSVNVSLSVQALPANVFAGNDATVCETCTLSLSEATAENFSSLLWTTTGDGNFINETELNPSYIPGINDIGTFVTLCLHVSPIAPCDGLPFVDCLDLFVETAPLQPVANAGADQEICENQFASLAGDAQNYSSVMWSGGDGVFSAPNSLITDYEPGPGDILAGTAELCLTAELIVPNAVPAVDCLTLTIFPLPNVNAGSDATICESQVFVTNPLIANYSQIFWTSDGDGYFDDETLEITNYNPGSADLINGQVNLCLVAFGAALCTSDVTDCLILYIEALPTAYAGGNASVCEGENLLLNGSASSYDELLWTTTGTGTFDDATILNPVYTPGNVDIAAGTVGLCLTATSLGACVLEVVEDCLELNIISETTITGLDTERTLDCSDFDQINHVFLPIELFPVIENESSILWTTDGDGTFNDPTIENPVYTPGNYDIWNGGFVLCVQANQVACPFSAEACVHIIVPIQIIPIEIPSWNGISSYVDKSAATVPSVMAPVVNDLIIMINKAGKYYWPVPSPPINQIGNLMPVGYKAKFSAPTCLSVYGQAVANQSFLINGGNTYLPVLTNVMTNVQTLLGANASKVLLIYDWSNGEIWTNNAADFQALYPGKAYLLVNKTSSTSFNVTFPDFNTDNPIDGVRDIAKGFEFVNSPWNEVVNTSQPHIILFADGAMNELQAGDIIGAFNDDGLCIGVTRFESKDNLNRLIVMGNDPYTERLDGYDSGENLQFRVYRSETGATYEITFTYDPNYPAYDGKFEINGVSSVISTTMDITGLSNPVNTSTVKVYPNPANEVINIVSDFEINRLKLVNLTGQSVIDYTTKGTTIQVDVSKYVRGLYFLQIETTNGEVITKRIVIE